MPLFGPLHLSLLLLIAAVAAVLSWWCRRHLGSVRQIRMILGTALAVNELSWWAFRYGHEGWRFPHNMPIQLCDVTLWAAVIASLTLSVPVVEFAYFAGLSGAGMALLTPDLWSPWPTYPAVYFFLAHGGIVIIAAVLVFGRVVVLRRFAVWRAFGLLVAYAALVGGFNAIFGTNYMYLCRKPAAASALDALGPWPMYLVAGGLVGLAIFWLLWLPVTLRTGEHARV